VEDVWRELRRKLTATWERELYSQREIYLIVKNVSSQAEAEEIAFILKSDLSSVVEAGLIGYREETAEFGLTYRGWPEQFLMRSRCPISGTSTSKRSWKRSAEIKSA